MTVGEYLKELRQAKGISQKELSGLTNGEVSNAEISRLEAGIRKKPSPAILKILAPHLGVPVSLLLSRAGYMDDMPASQEQGSGESGAAGGEPDRQYLERLQILEDERSALRKANQELKDEAEANRTRLKQWEEANQQWEEKYKALQEQAPPGAGSGALEEENRALKEKSESLREESRRIKEETILLLEEASSLRVESDNFRKRLAAAEDATKKARQAQEEAEEELLALREKGVMFVPESDEEQDKEFDKLKNELLNVIEQKNDLIDENEHLTSKIGKLEDQINEIRNSGDNSLIAAADMIQEISDMEDRLKEAAAEKTKLNQEKSAMAQEIEPLRKRLAESEAKHEKLITETLALEKVIEDYKSGSGEPGVGQGGGENQAALEAEIDTLKSRIAETEAQLMAAKETVKLSSPVLESMGTIEVAGMDLGMIFMQTARDAGTDDLEMLGKLMQAMSSDVIRASDKKMLMDILKRFVK